MRVVIDTSITQRMRNVPKVYKTMVEYHDKHPLFRSSTLDMAKIVVDSVRMVSRFGVKVEMTNDEFMISCKKFNSMIDEVIKHSKENGIEVEVYETDRL